MLHSFDDKDRCFNHKLRQKLNHLTVTFCSLKPYNMHQCFRKYLEFTLFSLVLSRLLLGTIISFR